MLRSLKAPGAQVFWLLFCGVFLFYPLVWGAMAAPEAWVFWPRLTLFDNAVTAVFALFLLLTSPHRLCAFLQNPVRAVRIGGSIALILLAVLIAQQLRLIAPFSFCSGLFLLTVPLFGAVFAPELRRELPFFALALFCLNLLQFGSDWYFHSVAGNASRVIAGLTSNWNWSASLLVATAPLLPAALRWKQPLAFRHLAGTMIAAAAIAALVMTDQSKGMILGLLAALGLLFAMRFPAFFSVRRVLLMLLGAAIPAAAAAFLLRARLAGFLANDIRLDLFEAAWKLFLNNPLLGCGQDFFVGKINPLIPEGYHLSAFAGDLHYHPHNELLLLLSELGLAGGVYFAGVAALLTAAFRKLRGNFDYLDYALFAAATLLLVHGMVDMTLYAWPLRLLFFLILGMLLARCAGAGELHSVLHRRLFFFLSLCAIAVTTFLLAINLFSGYCYRTGSAGSAIPPRLNERVSPELVRQLQMELSREYLRDALNFKPTPNVAYALAMDAMANRKYEDALRYFLKIQEMGYDSYIHSDGMLARACAMSGRYEQSLPFFEREQQSYPFGAVNLYFHSYAESRLGHAGRAKMLLEECQNLLALKGYSEKDIPALIRNPILDRKLSAEALNRLKAIPAAETSTPESDSENK